MLTSGEGVGIDIGIKDLAVCSDGNTYPNLNKTRKIKKIRKRQRRQQCKVSRKYLKNKKGVSYCKTCKCRWNNIAFITADRYYPSSKMCCICGHIKKDLKLSEHLCLSDLRKLH